MDLPESDGPQTVGMGRVERSGAGLGHSAFSALLDAPARGIAGAPIPLESKSLADGQVNVRHIVHPEYGAGLELNLRLSNPASALQALRDGGSEQRPFVIENMDQDHDGRTNLDTTRSRVLNFQGLGYDTVDPRTIDHRTPDPQDHSQEILRPGRYQVNVLGGSWEALEGKARIRVYGGSRNELETNLREALVHSGLLSITETTGASGRNPELQRSEVFPGYLATSDPDQPQRYRDLGVHYLFVGVPCAEAVISTLQGDGVLSTAERINRGLEPRGKSWQLDLLRDGGDNAYAAMVTEKARGLDFNFDHACYLGQYQLHYSTETLERTDWTAHTSDGFGSRGGLLYGKELVDQIRYEMSNDEWWDQREAMEMGWQTFITYPHNEVLFPKGLSNRHLTGISCQSADSRRQLLDALHQAGIERVAGKPVEEAVQLREKML